VQEKQSPEIASPAFAEPALMKMGGQAYSFLAMTDKPLFIRVLDPLQECPKYAPRVPLNGLQF